MSSGSESPGTWLRDPAAIYAASFAAIRAAVDLDGLARGDAAIALRIVHACAMPEIVASLAFAGDPYAAGRAALEAGAAVLVDCRMAEVGIDRSRLPTAATVRCTLNDPGVPGLASDLRTTRSAAAVELWRPHLQGAVVVVGNAPTALFHLLERLTVWPERPACLLAFPVGYVGAAESKDLLIAQAHGIPYATLRGRLGGSAMAAAAFNALLHPLS